MTPIATLTEAFLRLPAREDIEAIAKAKKIACGDRYMQFVGEEGHL